MQDFEFMWLLGIVCGIILVLININDQNYKGAFLYSVFIIVAIGVSYLSIQITKKPQLEGDN